MYHNFNTLTLNHRHTHLVDFPTLTIASPDLRILLAGYWSSNTTGLSVTGAMAEGDKVFTRP